MSTCSEESDTTQCSNAEDYYCYTKSSNNNSPPSQEVPQIAAEISPNTPYLKIHEQPQFYFKFRYSTEMTNSHGCLFGKSYKKGKTEKIYPEVELKNFNGEALVTCNLVQLNCDEHPHKLQSGDDSDAIEIRVPQEEAYTVRLRGLSIIHTRAKDVPDWLWNKIDTEKLSSKEIAALRKTCKAKAKQINLNIVRLKFSALDPETLEEICEPVYSDAIKNIKSAATNMLKICRMSSACGRAQGGDDIIMLVEKVVKNNIMIKFYEKSKDGIETWTDKGRFLESDVFHQYAISFRTPPYKNENITSRVEVSVQLVRPSDGQTSEPKKFFYSPNPCIRNKKRKFNCPYEDQPSTSTITNTVENAPIEPIPPNVIVENVSYNPMMYIDNNNGTLGVHQQHQPTPLNVIVENVSYNPMMYIDNYNGTLGDNQQQEVLSIKVLPNIDEHANRPDNSHSSNPLPLPSQEEMEAFSQIDLSEYMNDDFIYFLDSNDWLKDSGRGNKEINAETQTEQEGNDGILVKMMVNHLQDMIKIVHHMDASRRDIVTVKLKDLFDIRLSNGDTFLHLTLESRQPLWDFIVNLINEMDMIYLLNLRNCQMHTILHLTIAQDIPNLIPFLISKGCDPMLEDCDGNTAIHYAVMNPTCLEPLLIAIANNNVPCDLDAFNNDWQMALHLAVIYKNESSIRLLLKHGASFNARDRDGRTALHLAAYDDCLPAALALADHVTPEDIDEVDGRGNTALQIACSGGLKENTVNIVKALLEKKADPVKGEFPNISAWKMAKDVPELRELMRSYIPKAVYSKFYDKQHFRNGFSSDEFESADEGDFEEAYEQLGLPTKLEKLTLAEK